MSRYFNGRDFRNIFFQETGALQIKYNQVATVGNKDLIFVYLELDLSAPVFPFDFCQGDSFLPGGNDFCRNIFFYIVFYCRWRFFFNVSLLLLHQCLSACGQ